jgi:hypothetical protein
MMKRGLHIAFAVHPQAHKYSCLTYHVEFKNNRYHFPSDFASHPPTSFPAHEKSTISSTSLRSRFLSRSHYLLCPIYPF